MSDPLISVVVPTRNRPDTLEACLRGLRHHTSPRIEIVVQDNSSNDASEAVVRAAAALDPRIRYSPAPFEASQRQNFEFGLAAARGAYLAIIGDDDGFTIGSLDFLAERLQEDDVDAVRWNLLHYVWPSLSEDGEGFLDVYPSACFGPITVEPAAPMAEQVIRAGTRGSWEHLLVYHGMISRRVYDRMRAKTGGVFFAYPMPDVYAHNVIAFFCDTYLQVNAFVSIYGVSGHSAGASWTRASAEENGSTAAGKRWMQESVADEVAQLLPWQPDIRTLRYHDFAALEVARAHGMLGSLTPDPEIWAQAILTELALEPAMLAPWLHATPKAPYDALFMERVRASFGGRRPAAAATRHKHRYDPRLPSLRIRAISAEFPDDVQGAMLAFHALAGPQPAVLPPGRAHHLGAALWAFLHAVYRRAPRMSSGLLNSGFVPPAVLRMLRTGRMSRGPARDLQRRLFALQRSSAPNAASKKPVPG
jgi:hypothetical protein